MQKKTIIFLAVIAVFSFFGRFFIHPPNFTPVGALGLISGKIIGPIKAGIMVLAVLLLSDFFLGFYHWQIIFSVYGSFAIYGIIGHFSQKFGSLHAVIGPLIGASLFFLITNFFVWLFSPLYPQTLNGLFLSYLMAVPFYKNMLAGDLLFTPVFAFAYFTILNWSKILAKTKPVLIHIFTSQKN